mmetsp:Transcript_21312/g.64912  ORF Transcript_21312/g.64912 Transcript_21312/m.64912 type:complete len:206 (+) Transcript_21312:974-1591(+)
MKHVLAALELHHEAHARPRREELLRVLHAHAVVVHVDLVAHLELLHLVLLGLLKLLLLLLLQAVPELTVVDDLDDGRVRLVADHDEVGAGLIRLVQRLGAADHAELLVSPTRVRNDDAQRVRLDVPVHERADFALRAIRAPAVVAAQLRHHGDVAAHAGRRARRRAEALGAGKHNGDERQQRHARAAHGANPLLRLLSGLQLRRR